MDNVEPYNRYNLVKEMLEASQVVKNIQIENITSLIKSLEGTQSFFLTGEGSSRIFPAKRAVYQSRRDNSNISIYTEGATQALEYFLMDMGVFGASNSGKTKEVVRLFNKLKNIGHSKCFGLTAISKTPVADMPKDSYILGCGKESAVAATKSVIEQALFYHILFNTFNQKKTPNLNDLSNNIKKVLTTSIDLSIINTLSRANIVHFAGRNNGVAEELALKTNEITRKKSTYLEGTYAVHGIEEVMNKEEALVIVEPFEEEEDKFKECLVDGVGMPVIAIASRTTLFPTIQIPKLDEISEYLQLCAGWNLLVEIGLRNGVDLDHPVRARKVGNEFIQ